MDTGSKHLHKNIQGTDKLTDGDLRTKLCVQNEGEPVELTIKLDKPAVVTSVSMISADDVPDRDPRHWIFEGRISGESNWTIIAEIKDQPRIKERWGRVAVSTQNITPYAYCRLRFLDNHGDAHFQLAELDLHSE